MSRHMSRARVRRSRRLTAAAGAVASAAVVGVLAPAPARAALTVNLQLPGGATSMFIGGDQTNTDIPVQVWATVTGTTPINPVPTGGTSPTAAATTGVFDGLDFLYYNVKNSNTTGTLISGGVSSAPLNTVLNYNGQGSQVGTIANTPNGFSLGSNASIGGVAKPRGARTVFDNFSSSNGSGGYNVRGGDNVNIRINSPTSVSFLVQTLNFRPSAYAQRNKTTFTVDLPTTALLASITGSATGLYAPANWSEDTTNQVGTNGMPEPVSGNKNTSPTVGTQVVIQDTLAGDANLDGTVGFTDLTTVLQNFNTTTSLFSRGDFNGDGAVNFTDLTSLLQNFNVSLLPVTPSFVAASPAVFADPAAVTLLRSYNFVPTAVPEPSSVAALAVTASALMTRSRRRHRRATVA